MAKLKSNEEIIKEAAHKAMEEVKVNGMTLFEFADRINTICENNNCNLTTCRYYEYGKCTNEEERKECIYVSKKVLCLE